MQLAWLKPRRSLAGRLALAVTGAVSAALILAAALSVWRDVDRYAADKRAALTAVAQVFAYGGARATADDNSDAADASLRAIARVPYIVYGAIERVDGSVLAEQGIGLRLTQDVDLDGEAGLSLLRMLATRTLRADVQIVENGRTVGRVVLIRDTSDLFDQIKGAGQNAALVALLAITLGIGMSMYLQRRVTRPLTALAHTMDVVRLKHDYKQRAAVVSNDEVGALARTFNDLLSAVNERDHRLAAHGERLEEEVRARTAELSEAKYAAESANEAKSTFLATMSHEIRTPMHGVLVMAELLASSDLPARQRRYADVIARSGKTLLSIINDILDFAKVEAGKLDLERVAVSPAEIADSVVTLFSERARTSGLDLAALVAPDVPQTIIGDPVRLGQIVSNFVSNALKFTQAGHVAVRITMDPIDGWLIIAVTDTGIGIPQDKLTTIFSAFTQADQSTTRRFGGTGLGLSITQRLIEAMGGTVGVESRVGAGSTFWARIPVEAGVATTSPIVRMPGVVPTIVLSLSGCATRDALTFGLRSAGFEPAEAAGKSRAHWVLDAAVLVTMGRRPEGAERVVVLGALGETSAEQAKRDGLADEVLRWPVMQADWQPILAALATGRAFAQAASRETFVGDRLPRFPGVRVLVADDSAVNREVAIEALARCGVIDVVVVEDGAAAVEAAASQRFDLILMDGSMPILDGFSAARTIRKHEGTAGTGRTPIVALTAHVLGEAAEAWQAAGMDEMLSKPFTLKQLAAVLQKHATERQSLTSTSVFHSGLIGTEKLEPRSEYLFDADTLNNILRLGDDKFVRRIVQMYCQQAPTALAALGSAIRQSNQAAIAKAAHSLKSTSLNIGARALSARLESVEIKAREKKYDSNLGDFEAIVGLLNDTLIELKNTPILIIPTASDTDRTPPVMTALDGIAHLAKA